MPWVVSAPAALPAPPAPFPSALPLRPFPSSWSDSSRWVPASLRLSDDFPNPTKIEGTFPEYGPKGRRVRKDKGKKKRGMSAYNLFLRETISGLKQTQSGRYKDKPKEVFRDAVAMWKEVSPGQKAQLEARIKEMFGDAAGQTIEAPSRGAANRGGTRKGGSRGRI